jgi:hypothetical protein
LKAISLTETERFAPFAPDVILKVRYRRTNYMASRHPKLNLKSKPAWKIFSSVAKLV